MGKIKTNIVAKGLRSETVITQDKKYLIITNIQEGKRTVSKKVFEISEKQAKNYKLIGKAQGMNLFHCLYIASKYSKNFRDRVTDYVIVKPTEKRYEFAVAFYENKKNS